MRKDIRKRLERALITLQEPGGSTIRSIIKVINRESPILSLRKLLEALQEGINEGFLCMYNGRFKLKKQVTGSNANAMKQAAHVDSDDLEEAQNDQPNKSSDVELELEESSADESVHADRDDLEICKKSSRHKGSSLRPSKRRYNVNSTTKDRNKWSLSMKTPRYSKKSGKRQAKSKHRTSRKEKLSEEADNDNCDSLLETDMDNRDGKMMGRAPIEKPDIKRQRGPRCTSMKKDVRMPSKVHIPFVPSIVPQRNSAINELLRRSPEPVNGPLYDSSNKFACKPYNLEYFGAYC
ncbi:hypothetical protein RUM44_004472 [Polyplax serrata]|uniref:H15 domain-containing protein n=1 Tax=Polyplax serrata TaxID=468196 RepID=A0ABR1B2Z5_POLSC